MVSSQETILKCRLPLRGGKYEQVHDTGSTEVNEY